MLQQYCLREDEISRLIEVEIYDGELYEDEAGFFALMGAWRSWETEFVCLTRTLSIVLERKQKLSLDVQEILKSIYSLPAEKGLGLVFEEMDEAFISYMWGGSELGLHF
ncbi:hypothetical protein KFU94_51025 [Chloroflexi bacterium TSY]|nr:hypothetical protein [Chloroflexi bacterium TSY]